jgi:uncharacterized protein YhhL (DUF1145 family)
MSSGQAFDVGVPALLGVWILVGALAAAVLEWRLAKTRPLDWRDHAGLMVLVLFGPLALLAVAAHVAIRPRSRQP